MQAIFGNPDTIISQVVTTTVESELVGSSNIPVGPINDTYSVRGNPKTKPKRWDFTPSPKKDRIAYMIFGEPFNMIEKEREMELERRDREMDRRDVEEIPIEHEEEEQAENEPRP